MDIHKKWDSMLDENASAGVIMGFTTELVKFYWRQLDLAEVPNNKTALVDAYRKQAMSGNYYELKCTSAEFILEHTEIDLRVT